ncbi:rhodanese-like domain-containing protein [Sphaerisporangium sp. NPDC051011]|uniref:rhodanese-like domain-containing protein n=1 Tax=Sphaerisporangium sp. NPDC051011 TaxID=3155792 RepID=UPI0033F4EBFE
MHPVTREELLAAREAGPVQLVEALAADAYTAEHISGARNVPGRLTAEPAEAVAPDRATAVVVYCSGPYRNRSTITAAAFVRLGYADVRIYAGGKQDRAQAGLAFAGSRASAPAGVGRAA